MRAVRKRDGTVVAYDSSKISNAIWSAAKACGGTDEHRAHQLTDKVLAFCNAKYGENSIIHVEDIQNAVEKVLIEEGHAQTAKAYILYRQSHSELRTVKELFDSVRIVDDYLDLEDWMVKENSNMGYSLQGLNNYISTKMISKYWIGRIYPQNIKEAHENGDIHIHDLGTLGAYCVGWDMEDLLIRGFGGVPGKIYCKPPKHFRTALGQIVNFFYTLQGETAGAQAFSNIDTFLAPFIAHDGLNYEQVKQAMQEFVFNLNVPTRVGFQTPFTNVTLDLVVPEYMKNQHVIIGGVHQKNQYKEFQKEMDMFNQAFAQVMIDGDAIGNPFTFPIPTYNITKEFDWNNTLLEPIWEMTAKYGTPYFSNFVNSDMKPEDARSMCCRLRLDQASLRKRGGGLFGANPQTGSIGVVTINLPAIAFQSQNSEEFLERLSKLMDISYESLEIKRKTVESFTKKGLYPYSAVYLSNVFTRFGEYWKNHFSTIGLLGMNEAIMNLMPGETVASKKGQEFATNVLDFMRNRMVEYQEKSGNMYNLEATPGEATSHRFARIDKKRFPSIIVANEEAMKLGAAAYYTNSTQLPVGFTNDIVEAFELQEPLQTRYTGGTVLHGFLGERPPTNIVPQLVKKLAHRFTLPYFTLTPTFSICPKHGYLSGDHEYCPKCDALIVVDQIKKQSGIDLEST